MRDAIVNGIRILINLPLLLLKSLQRNIKKLFVCGVCEAKDEHIADLRAQLAVLEEVTRPSKIMHSPSLLSLESDAVLSGRDEVIEVKEEMTPEELEIVREADRILSGNY